MPTYPTYYSHALTKDEFMRTVKHDPSKVFITGADDLLPIYGSVERVLMERGRITVMSWSIDWRVTVRFSGRDIVIL